ncbi:MAG TPA: hypothetical protein VGR92_21085 [Steroidobacteraceae bacterium]|nr:hypothetical protein [Steroidobacteraceae bacterium]
MRSLIVRCGGALLLAALLTGCNKLGLSGHSAPSKELPSAQQLKSIAYMSQTAGPDGRQVYDHLDQAKSCHDLEIAMRWNRPPDVKGGPFDAKMTYVASSLPAGLKKSTEVLVTGVIKAGQSMSSGGSVWSLRLQDGSEVQAVEAPEYTAKQEEAQQAGGNATMLHPYTAGRLLCAYGIYQGNIGMALDQHGRVPLVSVMFAIDRRK